MSDSITYQIASIMAFWKCKNLKIFRGLHLRTTALQNWHRCCKSALLATLVRYEGFQKPLPGDKPFWKASFQPEKKHRKNEQFRLGNATKIQNHNQEKILRWLGNLLHEPAALYFSYNYICLQRSQPSNIPSCILKRSSCT